MITIGLIREGKQPPDTRVPITPKQCLKLSKENSQLSIKIQPSLDRCFKDYEYTDLSLPLQEDLSDCDILMGVKEVKIEDLIAGKTYLYFSHTKKKQAYNQPLMQAMIEKKIRMVDYESLTYENGKRIIGFGFFAGVVGAHNALLTYGKKTENFNLIAANQCVDMSTMEAQYANLKLPALKIVITGDGRVGQGILHIMGSMKIKEVEPEEFLTKTFDYPVFTHLTNNRLYQHKTTRTYNREDFHENPENYNCLFSAFISSDILINGIYWEKKIPRLFEKESVHDANFKIKVIADVTCDENGSVPINIGSSTIADPVYGYSKTSDCKVEPFQNDADIIDVMAVDNLPNELPRDASGAFGAMLMELVIPEFFKDQSDIIDRATICRNGKLGEHFQYLSDYAFPDQEKI